jgi:predicted CXXCH cytochrome family protein
MMVKLSIPPQARLLVVSFLLVCLVALGCTVAERCGFVNEEQKPGQPSLASADGSFTLPAPRSYHRAIHAPIVQQTCAPCHDPERNWELAEDMAAACAECHDAYFGEFVVHEPAAEGRCTDCHVSHYSRFSGLLTRPQLELCTQCHAMRDLPRSHRSDPDFEDCVSCHDPHFLDE